jgi:hypothetical protein
MEEGTNMTLALVDTQMNKYVMMYPRNVQNIAAAVPACSPDTDIDFFVGKYHTCQLCWLIEHTESGSNTEDVSVSYACHKTATKGKQNRVFEIQDRNIGKARSSFGIPKTKPIMEF